MSKTLWSIVPAVAALCAYWQPANAQVQARVDAGAGVNWIVGGTAKPTELDGYQGLYNNGFASGNCGYDCKPYTAASSGYAVSKESVAFKLSGTAAVTGAAYADARTQFYLADDLYLDTASAFGPLVIHYSLMIERKATGSYSMPDADQNRLLGVFGVHHYVSGSGNDILRLEAVTRWDSATNSLSEVSTENGVDAAIYGVHHLSANINSGQWTTFVLQMYDFAYVNPYAGSSDTYMEGITGEMSFSSSLFWGGISSITRQDGSAVHYTLSSRSGVDYSRSYIPSPVPEPSTYALFGAGLAVLAWFRSKKRKTC